MAPILRLAGLLLLSLAHASFAADSKKDPVLNEPAAKAEVPWPATKEGLVFAWRNQHSNQNAVIDSSGVSRTCTLSPMGDAKFDRNGEAMVRGDGYFVADETSNKAFAASWKAAQKRTTGMTSMETLVRIEMVITPESVKEKFGGNLFTFGRFRFAHYGKSTQLHAPYLSPSSSGGNILSAHLRGPDVPGTHRIMVYYGFGGKAGVRIGDKAPAKDVGAEAKPEPEPEIAIFSERELGGADAVRLPAELRFGFLARGDKSHWRGKIKEIAVYVYATARRDG